LEDKWQSGMVTQMEADIEAVNSAVKQTLIWQNRSIVTLDYDDKYTTRNPIQLPTTPIAE